MLPVNLNNNINQYKKYNYNTSFSASPTKDELITIMPFKAKKLVKRMNLFLEDEWAKIKKEKNGFYNKPYYTIPGKDKEVATITPLYQGYNKYILFEVSKGENTHKIIINRKNPDSFKYEKTVDTDYGCATTKTFNSDLERNNTI